MQISKPIPAVALVAAALFFSFPAIAQTPDAATAEFDRLLDSALTQRETTVALAQVGAATRLSNFVTRDHYAQALDAAAHAARDPLVAFALHQKAAWAFAEMKDTRYGADGMSGPLGDQGCLRDFVVVGPFDNPAGQGFHGTLGPELGEIGPYQGKLTEVNWRPLPRHDRYCEFNLNQFVQPSTAAAAYVATQITAPQAKRSTLLLGVNGAYKVWLNGELVAQREEDAGMSPDNDAWPIELDSGANDLLIKLASGQDGGLGIVARVVDAKLRPFELETAAKWSRIPAETAASPKPDLDRRGVLAEIEANAKKLRGDQAAWNAWLWKSANWPNVAVPWRDAAQRLIADPDELTPRMHALLAELYEEHWERLAILEKARARAPDDPWIGAAYAAELENSIAEGQRLQTRALYEKWAATGFLPAALDLSDWYKRNALSERALKVLEQLERPDRNRIPGVVMRLAALHEDIGSLETASKLEEQVAAVMYLSGGHVWEQLRDALVEGSSDRALALLDEYQQFVPASTYARTRRAEILRARGDIDAAIAVYDGLIAQSPGDSDLYEDKARLLIAANRRDAALATVRMALVRRPQDQELRDFVSYLEPDTSRFHEPWMIENPRELAANTPAPTLSFDTIVDNSVTYVAQNGLASTVVQRVDRVLTPEGVDAVKATRAAYQAGDEEVEVLRVRVLKADGTVSEDHDQWDSDNTRKGSTTYNDTAYVTMRANDVEVGDLVEFRYRTSQIANQNFRGDYFGDIAYLQGGQPIAFQRWAVIYPASWQLYFREPKLDHRRIENLDPRNGAPPEGFRSTSFELTDVPRVETDPAQPGYSDVYDYLLVSNKKTYDEIGRWWWSLVEEQLIVDAPIREKVKELTAGLETDDDKIVAIHNYVVKNTRYLHVGLGIHGWKPYRTSTCFRNRYGDCKDKAALLKVMLEAAGIPANLVLVRTRRLGHVEPQPASMHVFNHAITYVPSKKLFLDGTAEFNGTTELTTMDQGAQALIVEDGGEARLVTLPVDDASRNLMRTTLDVDLSGDEAVVRGTLEAHGANAVFFRQSLEDPERRDEALEAQLADEFPGAKLASARYRDLSELEKPSRIEFVLQGGELLRADGSREYVLPMGRPKNLLDAYASRSRRNQDLVIRVPFSNQTEVRYRLPATRRFVDPPRNTKLESKFGSLDIQYRRDGRDLLVDVKYSIDVPLVKVEDYQDFRQFLADVTAAMNESVRVVPAQ